MAHARLEFGLCGRNPGAGRYDLCLLRRDRGRHLLGVEARQKRARRDSVADRDPPLGDLAAYPKAASGLDLRADFAGQPERVRH